MSFATDTAVTQIGPGRSTAELHERWSSLVGIHGGYTAAIVANAMTTAVDDPSRALRSCATQFASIPRPGPVDIEVVVERTGKSMTTTSARLLQEGRVLQVAHAASSTTRPGLAYDDHVRPATPTLATSHGSRPPTTWGTSRTPMSGSTQKRSSSAADTKRSSRRGCGHSRANRSTRHGW